MKTRTVQLGEVCDFIRGVTFPSGEGNDKPFENSVACLTTSGVQKEVAWESRRFIPKSRIGNDGQVLRAGDILISTANSKELVGKSCLVHRPPFDCTFGAFVTVARPSDKIYPPYLAYWMSTPTHLAWCFKSSSNTTNISNLRVSELQELEFALPELSEQQRIAGRLEAADGLRRTRRYALELSATFLPAAFLQLFGDSKTLMQRWERKPFVEILAADLRNGLSPSTKGKVQSRVLTLSAITRGGFDSDASKLAAFITAPPKDKRVSTSDFLICRGNGNLSMVGIGRFPLSDMPDCVFPDTMIAAQVQPEIISKEFLETVWHTPALRRQIESSARTTNGTHKVNQEALEDLEIPLPPLALQHQFAGLVARVERLRAVQRESLRQAEHHFQSLLHQAFNQGSKSF